MFTKSGLKGKYKSFRIPKNDNTRSDLPTKEMKTQKKETCTTVSVKSHPPLSREDKNYSEVSQETHGTNHWIATSKASVRSINEPSSLKSFKGVNIEKIKCTFDQSRQLLSMKPMIKLKRLKNAFGNNMAKCPKSVGHNTTKNSRSVNNHLNTVARKRTSMVLRKRIKSLRSASHTPLTRCRREFRKRNEQILKRRQKLKLTLKKDWNTCGKLSKENTETDQNEPIVAKQNNDTLQKLKNSFNKTKSDVSKHMEFCKTMEPGTDRLISKYETRDENVSHVQENIERKMAYVALEMEKLNEKQFSNKEMDDFGKNIPTTREPLRHLATKQVGPAARDSSSTSLSAKVLTSNTDHSSKANSVLGSNKSDLFAKLDTVTDIPRCETISPLTGLSAPDALNENPEVMCAKVGTESSKSRNISYNTDQQERSASWNTERKVCLKSKNENNSNKNDNQHKQIFKASETFPSTQNIEAEGENRQLNTTKKKSKRLRHGESERLEETLHGTKNICRFPSEQLPDNALAMSKEGCAASNYYRQEHSYSTCSEVGNKKISEEEAGDLTVKNFSQGIEEVSCSVMVSDFSQEGIDQHISIDQLRSSTNNKKEQTFTEKEKGQYNFISESVCKLNERNALANSPITESFKTSVLKNTSALVSVSNCGEDGVRNTDTDTIEGKSVGCQQVPEKCKLNSHKDAAQSNRCSQGNHVVEEASFTNVLAGKKGLASKINNTIENRKCNENIPLLKEAGSRCFGFETKNILEKSALMLDSKQSFRARKCSYGSVCSTASCITNSSVTGGVSDKHKQKQMHENSQNIKVVTTLVTESNRERATPQSINDNPDIVFGNKRTEKTVVANCTHKGLKDKMRSPEISCNVEQKEDLNKNHVPKNKTFQIRSCFKQDKPDNKNGNIESESKSQSLNEYNLNTNTTHNFVSNENDSASCLKTANTKIPSVEQSVHLSEKDKSIDQWQVSVKDIFSSNNPMKESGNCNQDNEKQNRTNKPHSESKQCNHSSGQVKLLSTNTSVPYSRGADSIKVDKSTADRFISFLGTRAAVAANQRKRSTAQSVSALGYQQQDSQLKTKQNEPNDSEQDNIPLLTADDFELQPWEKQIIYGDFQNPSSLWDDGSESKILESETTQSCGKRFYEHPEQYQEQSYDSKTNTTSCFPVIKKERQDTTSDCLLSASNTHQIENDTCADATENPYTSKSQNTSNPNSCKDAIVQTLKELATVLQFLSENNNTNSAHNVSELPVSAVEHLSKVKSEIPCWEAADFPVATGVNIKQEPTENDQTFTETLLQPLKHEMLQEEGKDELPFLFDCDGEANINDIEDFGLPPFADVFDRETTHCFTEREQHIKHVEDTQAMAPIVNNLQVSEQPIISTDIVKKEPQSNFPRKPIGVSGNAKPGVLNKCFNQRKNMFDVKIGSGKHRKMCFPFPAKTLGHSSRVAKTDHIAPAQILTDKTDKPSELPQSREQGSEASEQNVPGVALPYDDSTQCEQSKVIYSKLDSQDAPKEEKSVTINQLHPVDKSKSGDQNESNNNESTVDISSRSEVNVLKKTVTKENHIEKDKKTSSGNVNKARSPSTENAQKIYLKDQNKAKVPKKYSDDTPIIPFNKVMELKREQFRKYRNGLTKVRFIDYKEVHRRSATKTQHVTTSTGSKLPTSGTGPSDTKKKTEKQKKSKSSDKREASKSHQQKHRTVKSPLILPLGRRRLISKRSKSTLLYEDIEDNIPCKTLQSFNPPTVFKREPIVRKSFQSTGTGYFSWKKKYQQKKDNQPTKRSIPVKGKERGDRELLRQKIENCIREYRRTFQEGDKQGDAKVASFLQYLTEKLEVLQIKRNNLNKYPQHDPDIPYKPTPREAYRIRDNFMKDEKDILYQASPESHENEKHSSTLDDFFKDHLNRHYQNMTKQIQENLMKAFTNGLGIPTPNSFEHENAIRMRDPANSARHSSKDRQLLDDRFSDISDAKSVDSCCGQRSDRSFSAYSHRSRESNPHAFIHGENISDSRHIRHERVSEKDFYDDINSYHRDSSTYRRHEERHHRNRRTDMHSIRHSHDSEKEEWCDLSDNMSYHSYGQIERNYSRSTGKGSNYHEKERKYFGDPRFSDDLFMGHRSNRTEINNSEEGLRKALKRREMRKTVRCAQQAKHPSAGDIEGFIRSIRDDEEYKEPSRHNCEKRNSYEYDRSPSHHNDRYKRKRSRDSYPNDYSDSDSLYREERYKKRHKPYFYSTEHGDYDDERPPNTFKTRKEQGDLSRNSMYGPQHSRHKSNNFKSFKTSFPQSSYIKEQSFYTSTRGTRGTRGARRPFMSKSYGKGRYYPAKYSRQYNRGDKTSNIYSAVGYPPIDVNSIKKETEDVPDDVQRPIPTVCSSR